MENFSEKSADELRKSLKDSEKTLFGLYMKKCSSALDKPHIIASLKKEIARIKTFLKQKACKNFNN